MNPLFRKSTPSDCQTVWQLLCDLEQQELPYDRFASIYNSQLKNPNCCCLVCEHQGAVIGVLNLRFEEQLHHCARIGEIMEFAVSPACRNQGIGKAMLAYACQTAANAGCIQIEVASNQLRTDAHRFYLREGMGNFHYKFSKSLTGQNSKENRLGR